MKADTVELLGLFDKEVRYLVPLYQRNYKWDVSEHWAPLWDDIRSVAGDLLEFGESPELPDHFLGAIVAEQQPVFGRDALALHVIDGQQRLTTLQLFLAALHHVAAGRGWESDADYVAGLVRNKPAVVKDRVAHKYKVWPNVADRAGYLAAMEAGGGTSRPERAVRYFIDAIDDWLDRGDPDDPLDDSDFTPEQRMDALITAITRHLKLVKIDLETGDNAQLIFETLNGRGEPLTDADLIRNHLFRQADEEGDDVEALHEQFWRPFEADRWSEPIAHGRHQRERLHMFVNHWLSMRLRDQVPASAIFTEFKKYLATPGRTAQDVAVDLARYGETFDSFDSFPPDSREWWFFRRLNEMDLISVFPVLLYLYGLEDELAPDRRLRALVAIESFLVRRLVARASTRSYTAVFSSVLKAAADGDPATADDRVVAALAAGTADVDHWPDDDELLGIVLDTNVYRLKQSRLKMVLEGIERQMAEGGTTEQVSLGHSMWIEHLLPQSWEGADGWSLPDGIADPTEARLERNHLLHTLGNLTLTTSRLDIQLSNLPWPEKVERLGASTLLINQRVRTNWPSEWNEAAINDRGHELTHLMAGVWPSASALGADTATT